ncbi:MAG: ribonuclease PH [Candidatus Sumerlaeota bacterium]|nr:ribonuclease PH [Candidatus Sumerlaeota bacterium]
MDANASNDANKYPPRIDARMWDELRPVKVTPGYQEYADGSVLIEIGKTRVLCAATLTPRVPPHVYGTGRGWVTAEYSMLPRSSQERVARESALGRIGGRTHEIQRLIGRSLRSVVDLDRLGERQFILDCDVIQADGGTRTASITGAFLALALAIRSYEKKAVIAKNVIKDFCAAVSVGIVEGYPALDLCYIEDSQAEVDMNVVMTGSGRFIELQGTAERAPFDEKQLASLLALARAGVDRLIRVQKEVLKAAGIEDFEMRV